MDFRFNQQEEAFRREIRQFLSQELPPNWIGSVVAEDQYDTDEDWEFSRKMARKLGDKGWLALSWPKEYGGQARPFTEQIIFAEELAYNRVPGLDIIGIRLVGPTLIMFGTDEQKRQHIPPIARGEITWAEGFSEPEAGSDLAAVKTTAVEDGDYFVVNGQKVWTTGAHRAGWGFFLVRTDPKAPKHKGLSFLLIDMSTPGITVAPLKNIVGANEFNEIFLDNVRVPKGNLIGEKNEGWKVAMALLAFERAFIDIPAGGQRIVEELVDYAKEVMIKGESLAKNAVVRQRLAQMAVEVEIARLLSYRVSWMESREVETDSEAGMSKTTATELTQRLANTAMQVLGMYGQLAVDSKWARLHGEIQRYYLSTLSLTILAGTSEIQRNIVAQRGLGLPRS